MSIAPEFIVWTDPLRAPLMRQTATAMGSAVRAIGVGGPRSGEVSQLARELDCPCEDDLRKLLVERPAAFVLVATMTGVSREDLAAALAQGATVLAVEPSAGEFDDLSGPRVAGGGGRVLNVPAFTCCPGWRRAGEPQELLGQVRLMSFTAIGPAGECSLYARLTDAWRTVRRFTGLPESIDASLVGPLANPPEDPRSLAGHLTAHARLAEGCSAQVTLSDLTGRHRRQLLVIGDQGCLIVTDLGYELYDRSGKLLDQAEAPAVADPVELIAEQWRGLLEGRSLGFDRPPSATDLSEVLACCLASVLSARTGQPESPGKMLALHGVR